MIVIERAWRINETDMNLIDNRNSDLMICNDF